MRKLGKKLLHNQETIEAYICLGHCEGCSNPCYCSCDISDYIAYQEVQTNFQRLRDWLGVNAYNASNPYQSWK